MYDVREFGGDRDDVLVTVASLYYELGRNQQEIAQRLEISRSSVSRMIREARDRGIVEIRIHRPIYRDFRLEQGLIEHFGLQDAYVLITAPDTRDEQALAGVGRLAAHYLERIISTLPQSSSIGIAWGTGVHAAVSGLPEARDRQIDVVQILGAIGASNPQIDGADLARTLATKLGGRHYDLHAPALVKQDGLRDLLVKEHGVAEALNRGRSVSLAITGIGTVLHEASSYLRAGHLSPEELDALCDQGVVGESAGRFFDIDGRETPYAINERVVGLSLEDLRHIPRVIAIARGLPKAQSIVGALRGRYLTVLATDDITARVVLEVAGWREREPSTLEG